MAEAHYESLEIQGPPEHYFDAEREMTDFAVCDPHWYRQAGCKDADREEFYVSQRGRSNGDPQNLRVRFCMDCPVRRDCLAESVQVNDLAATVLGGLTRPERQVLIDRYRAQRGIPKVRRAPSINPDVVRDFLRAAEYLRSKPVQGG
jgi:hypothetical protein